MGEGAAERWLVWTGIKRSVCWWVECFRPRMCLRRWPRGFRWCRVFRVANVPRGELPDSLRTSGGGRQRRRRRRRSLGPNRLRRREQVGTARWTGEIARRARLPDPHLCTAGVSSAAEVRTGLEQAGSRRASQLMGASGGRGGGARPRLHGPARWAWLGAPVGRAGSRAGSKMPVEHLSTHRSPPSAPAGPVSTFPHVQRRPARKRPAG